MAQTSNILKNILTIRLRVLNNWLILLQHRTVLGYVVKFLSRNFEKYCSLEVCELKENHVKSNFISHKDIKMGDLAKQISLLNC